MNQSPVRLVALGRTPGLRAAAEAMAAVATACHRVGRALADHGCTPTMLGTVSAPGGFHGSLAQTLAAQAADAGAEQARRSDLAGRAAQASQLSSEMVTRTTAFAGAGAADGYQRA